MSTSICFTNFQLSLDQNCILMIPDKKKIHVPILRFLILLFADKCIRSPLPIALNSTPPRILHKI